MKIRFDPLYLACGIVLSLACAGALLEANYPVWHYRVVQEDGALEWATFWSFLSAGILFAKGASPRPWRQRWFGLGLALFCLLVAFEEISWGQRLLGLQPPEAFLAGNDQQEFNLHNFIDGDLRQNGFLAVCLGYGVGFALLQRVGLVAEWSRRLGLRAPPVALAPAFAVAGGVYAVYPWQFTGEWTEWMLGVCFLADALHARWGSAEEPECEGSRRLAASIVVAFLGCWALGWATAVAAGAVQRGDPALRPIAMRELEALRLDFANPRARTSCGLHRRVYAYSESNDGKFLRSGIFASLVPLSLPENRTRYFVDPWGSPYWVRHECNSARTHRSVLVYSLGPNRRRESTRWVIHEDDVGLVVKGSSFEVEPDFGNGARNTPE